MHADLYDRYPPEQLIRLSDPSVGLDGVIILHSTRLGPAAGGCRFWRYDSIEQASTDAIRLAEGMTYKNALAGLPLGGGKAVIRMPTGPFDREALFRTFGRAIDRLQGAYVTAEDVGTSISDMATIALATRHVAGLPLHDDRPSGDPSPWTALGVFLSMRRAAKRVLGADLHELTVAVQGLGNVGFALCERLHSAGATLIVAEPRAALASRAAIQFGASIVDPAEIIEARADIFAPCALGGVINSAAIERLNAKIVCGGANNQLHLPIHGTELADRGIVYAPDYVVNAGGIINVAAEYLGWTMSDVHARVEEIAARLDQVLDLAKLARIPPSVAADRLAQSLVTARSQKRSAA